MIYFVGCILYEKMVVYVCFTNISYLIPFYWLLYFLGFPMDCMIPIFPQLINQKEFRTHSDPKKSSMIFR